MTKDELLNGLESAAEDSLTLVPDTWFDVAAYREKAAKLLDEYAMSQIKVDQWVQVDISCDEEGLAWSVSATEYLDDEPAWPLSRLRAIREAYESGREVVGLRPANKESEATND